MTLDRFVTATVMLLLLSTSVSGFPPNISSITPSILPNITAGAWQSFLNFTGCRTGDHADGLARLKDYFHRFGYIPDSPSNFTDDFDDALESALKTYQHNFNLNPTGILDDQTVKQIVQPRCGVADIINGSSTMNSGKKASSSNGKFRTVAHYTFFPGKPRWPFYSRELTYSFLPENQLSNTVKSLFSRAFSRWAAVTTLTFKESEDYDTSDIRIGFYSGDHGDGEPFDGVLGTLAHAFSPPSGRFHLDGDENWVVDGDRSVESAVDLESVVVHEIGHLLGLGHSSAEDAIMYPTISSGRKKVDLARDDIDGIQELYGANPNYNGSSSPPSSGQERGWSKSGAHMVAVPSAMSIAMAVGFLILLL